MLTDPRWGSELCRSRAIDSAGNTSLHIVAKHGRLVEIRILLDRFLGSEMYLVNKNGKTPLHMAAEVVKVSILTFSLL